MIELTAVPTQADYVRASRASYLANLRSGRGILRLAVLVLIVVTGVSIWAAIEDGEVGFFPAIMLVVAIVAVGIGVTVNLLWLPRKVSRMFRQQPAYADAILYRWAEEGFALRSPISTLNLRWSQLTKWAETRDIFLLYITDFQCVFVPKRAATDEESAKLRSFLKQSVTLR